MSLLVLLLSILLPFSLLTNPSQSCGTTVYWGRNNAEGLLLSACATGNYEYVTIAFLTNFGSGWTPTLDLPGYCDPSSTGCTVDLAGQIRYCQDNGVKVLLSLGGGVGRYNISSPEDAKQVATYLWDNFLSDSLSAGYTSGPFGNAALDGINFQIDYSLSTLYWDDLAWAIAPFSSRRRKIYLVASPQCPLPNTNLDAAINTGLFDYVWVQFYGNRQCDYSGGAAALIASWNAWSSAIPPPTQLLLGLPASPEAAGSGYVDPDQLATNILPEIRKSRKYGGVMVWNRYYDLNNTYTPRIKSAVCSTTTTTTIKSQDLLVSRLL